MREVNVELLFLLLGVVVLVPDYSIGDTQPRVKSSAPDVAQWKVAVHRRSKRQALSGTVETFASTNDHCRSQSYFYGSTWVGSCPAGTFATKTFGNCMPCSSECGSCSTRDACTSCKADRILQNTVCVDKCNSGYVLLQRNTGTSNLVRLVPGPRPDPNSESLEEGRLEVRDENGNWGTVCNTSFTLSAANVVCRQLGLGSASSFSSGKYPIAKRDAPINLGDVKCAGQESSIFDCPLKRRQDVLCTHYQDVEISCSGPDTSTSCVATPCPLGYYVTQHTSSFATICKACDASCGSCSASATNCLTCPYGRFRKGSPQNGTTCVVTCDPGYYGNTDSMTCQKCSSSCVTCADGAGGGVCTSCGFGLYLVEAGKCVSVCPYFKVQPTTRLVNSSSSQLLGLVEVYYQGDWGPVCNDGFGKTEANVVCRSLGLGNVKSYTSRGSRPIPRRSGPTLLDDVDCNGNETDIRSCKHTPFRSHNCQASEDIYVDCYGPYVPPRTLVQCVRECPAGLFSERLDDNCIACGTECRACKDHAKVCTACPRGTFLLGTTCLSDCPTHMYANIVTNRCTPCAPECRTCADGALNTTCTSCSSNTFLSGTSCVAQCPAPMLASEQKCVTTCQDGFYPHSNSRLCIQCPGNCTRCLRSENGDVVCTECKSTHLEQNGACLASCSPGFLMAPVVYPESFIRLVGGGSSSGRIEVYYSGKWGTVCDDYWNSVNAQVVCRELGFEAVVTSRYSSSSAFTAAHNDDPIWMDNVQCKPTDRSLFNCSHHGWGRTDCSHTEDVAIRCKGSVSQRCVRTCSLGLFTTATGACERCSGSCKSCDTTSANCTGCKVSTFLYNSQCVTNCPRGFYKDYGTNQCKKCLISCDSCSMTASNCTSCNTTYYLQNNTCELGCGSQNYALIEQATMRLTRGRTPLEGSVQIFQNGKWGYVCDDYWSLTDGDVLCRQLHLGNVIAVFFRAYFGANSSLSIVLDDVRCRGNESRIEDCPSRSKGSHNCYLTEVAGVQCSGPDSSRRCVTSCPSTHITTASRTCEQCHLKCAACVGSASTCSACHTGFYLEAGMCKTKCSINFYNSSYVCKPCHASCRRCNGPTPSNCTDCIKPNFLQEGSCVPSCPGYILHVAPPMGIRLANGTARAGRVEVYDSTRGVWGTVCDDKWGIADAAVVCRHLGLGPPLITINQHNRSSAGTLYYDVVENVSVPIVLDDVSCRGSEPTLFDCNHAGVAIHNCQHREDAGVGCDVPSVTVPTCLLTCDTAQGYRVVDAVGRLCEKCDATCSQCSTSSASFCEQCISGRFLSASAEGKCVLKCEDGFYGDTDDGRCKPCSSDCDGCFNGNRDDICHRCNSTLDLVLSGTTCVAACPPGQRPLRDTFQTNTTNIRINGDRTVNLFINSKWIPICSSGRAWDRYAANVVCRQMGMGLAIKWTTSTTRNFNQPAVNSIQCLGTEANIFECKMATVQSLYTCYRASVVCNASLEAYDEEVCTTVNTETCSSGTCEAAAGCHNTTRVRGFKSACWECPRTFVGDGSNCLTYSLQPHRLVLRPSNRSAVVNQTTAVVLSCGANASTIINWYHETRRLSLLPTTTTTLDYVRPRFYYKLSATGSLLLGRIQLSMRGMYRCVSKTTWASVEDSAYLDVLSPIPITIVAFNSTTEIAEGTQYILRCKASGVPAPTITWSRRSGSIVAEDGVKYGLTNDSLILYSPTFADTDTYICTARNNYSSASASTIVRVKGAPQLSTTPPEGVAVKENDAITLTCGLQNFTNTVIFWLYPPSVYNANLRVVVTENAKGPVSTLTIRGAVRDDSGLYTCSAKNSVGQVDYQTSVTVIPTKVNVTDTVTLACADNYYNANTRRVLWSVLRSKRTSIVGGGRYLINATHLTISKAQVPDSGRYECLIVDVSKVELSRREVTLVVLGAPVLTPLVRNANFTVTAANLTQTVLLNVVIDSSTPVTAKWSKDGQAVNNPRVTLLANNSLMICNVQERDFGKYTVTVANAQGSAVLDDQRIAELVPPPSDSSSNSATIVIAVVCTIVGLALVVVVAVVVLKRRRDLNIFQVRHGDRTKVGKNQSSTRSTAAMVSDAPDSMAIGNRLAGDDGDSGFAKVSASMPTKPPQPAPQMQLDPDEDTARFTKNGVQSTLFTSV